MDKNRVRNQSRLYIITNNVPALDWCLVLPSVSLAELEVAMLNPAAGTRHAAVMQPLQPRAQPGHCRENIKYLVKGENICI